MKWNVRRALKWERKLICTPTYGTKVSRQELNSAKKQLTQITRLFCTVQKKTSEANAGAEAGFFRTQSIKTFTFLNIKFYGKGLLVTYPDICSVWTSQTINTIKFWIQLEYSKRCKHTSKDFMQQCQETL